MRVRRVWVAVPDADPDLVWSAQEGVILTCVTAAQRIGLWTFGSRERHIAVPSHAGRVDPDGVAHWRRPLVARDPARLVDGIENVLQTIALCRPYEEALVVWESAFRKELVDRFAMRRLPLRGVGRDLCENAAMTSDSGLETVIVPRLRWLKVSIVPQVWLFGHRVDYLIGKRLVLQIDGGTHVGGQRREDNRHDAVLMLRGYHVIRVGYRDIIEDWPVVQDLIVRAISQGLHLFDA